jgi:hypothetical protein
MIPAGTVRGAGAFLAARHGVITTEKETTMLISETSRPAPGEYAAFFEHYIGLITEADVIQVLTQQRREAAELFSGLSEARAGYRYEPGKWSIREVLGHVIDAERVFGYRAVCIARGEKAPLPGFDENDYAAMAGADAVPLAELVEEFLALRQSHEAMFRHFPEEAWLRIGTSNLKLVSVRALAYIMAGHARHHMEILRERYHLAG